MRERTLAEWVQIYRDELVAMNSIPLADDTRARQWNRHVDRMQRAQLELRKSDEGRAAITAMISDPVRTVAQWSAAHALFWAETEARCYLEAAIASEGVGSFEAKITLREFDAGRLRMDWRPKGR